MCIHVCVCPSLCVSLIVCLSKSADKAVFCNSCWAPHNCLQVVISWTTDLPAGTIETFYFTGTHSATDRASWTPQLKFHFLLGRNMLQHPPSKQKTGNTTVQNQDPNSPQAGKRQVAAPLRQETSQPIPATVKRLITSTLTSTVEFSLLIISVRVFWASLLALEACVEMCMSAMAPRSFSRK